MFYKYLKQIIHQVNKKQLLNISFPEIKTNFEQKKNKLRKKIHST